MSSATTGRVGSLTPEQETTLAQFKKEITEEGFFVPERHDDYCLLRFLRARKFDIAASKKMFIDCENWRVEFQVDDLVKNFEFTEGPEVQAVYPRFYHKTDKDGRPVYIEKVGQLDLKKLFAITDEERLTKNHVVSYEILLNQRFPACSAQAGHHIETSCTIIDLKGVSLLSFPQVAGMIKRTSTIAQNYYPEILGRMFIINAPMLFSSVWRLITPFLDEVTVSKIFILGSGYKSKLLEYIDAENLPAFLNGQCKCEGGCELSDAGPWKTGQEKLKA
ncbi:cytosolic factor, phosphatidylinositol/phosphatidylcholine transfer protein [Basidiobolus ranarum]|uniref:Cytosolic factor, phosphatidylinositol/phosphatidylcholine transfer protein n=1 Tax=Basidiobolus ranarum TaxID=34480 RepID=A0ABR2WX16_9FUNG